MPRLAALWLPAAAYTALIFYLSSKPYPLGPFAPPAPDWILHIAEYSVLGALYLRALAGGWNVPARFMQGGLVVAACVAVGAADEFWQSFTPGRFCSPLDAAADAIGALAGVAALAALSRMDGKRRAARVIQ